MKMTGHSLNGSKLILKPVNNETTARTKRHDVEIIYTAIETIFPDSMIVTVVTVIPMNIRATPSVIHSIMMIFLLSALIPPKPCTTFFVGKRCETPQNNGKADPM
jgi:hypothetical protein